jgi:excisionase family DNA binding protein
VDALRHIGDKVVMVQERLAYPINEAAYLVGISRATFYKEISRGAVKVIKIGAATRVPADELKKYLESLKGG